jgi:hypothetical protein
MEPGAFVPDEAPVVPDALNVAAPRLRSAARAMMMRFTV